MRQDLETLARAVGGDGIYVVRRSGPVGGYSVGRVTRYGAEPPLASAPTLALALRAALRALDGGEVPGSPPGEGPYRR